MEWNGMEQVAWTLGIFACRRNRLVAQNCSRVRGNRTSLENQKYGFSAAVLPQLDSVQVQFVQCRSLSLTNEYKKKIIKLNYPCASVLQFHCSLIFYSGFPLLLICSASKFNLLLTYLFQPPLFSLTVLHSTHDFFCSRHLVLLNLTCS